MGPTSDFSNLENKSTAEIWQHTITPNSKKGQFTVEHLKWQGGHFAVIQYINEINLFNSRIEDIQSQLNQTDLVFEVKYENLTLQWRTYLQNEWIWEWNDKSLI